LIFVELPKSVLFH